jgi:Zn/Cd-binding protein ZinT
LETLPELHFNEEKHDVSKKTLKQLQEVMFAQDIFGFNKYKKPLKHTYQYDWLKMLMEEMADGLKYLQNEMDRKELVINILEFALEHDDPKEFIQDALKILKVEGTGK